MIKFIKRFREEEDGAVTVDWVVLTAAVVGLGVAAVATLDGSLTKLGTTVEGAIETAPADTGL